MLRSLSIFRIGRLAGLCLAVLGVPSFAQSEADDSQKLRFFDDEVLPILEEHCLKCHGAETKIKGGLRLTSREGLLQGGDQGPAIDLKKPEASLFLAMISYRDDDHQMPPKGKLSPEKSAVLSRWIAMGAPYDPRRELAAAPDENSGRPTLAEGRSYWAFQPLKAPQLPEVNEVAWRKNPIDTFVLGKLSANGLSPASAAARGTLIRRAYYDLVGLPPTPDEVRAFEADESPGAFERVIDGLLASPRYGETWARHWLDLVRYAETNGYERDGPKPEAWRYRDYVIGAFNSNKPYDQFVREQIAGDELDEVTFESLVATGFQRLGIWDDEPVDADQAFYDSLDDVVATTGQTFLGLTVNCARCHDHKIDPIPQADYYRMLAFFRNTFENIKQGEFKKSAFTLNTTTPLATPAEQEDYARRKNELKERIEGLEAKILPFEDTIVATFSNPEKDDAKDERTRRALIERKQEAALSAEALAEYLNLRRELGDLKRVALQPLPQGLVIRENGAKAPETFILIRGSAHSPGDMVTPGFPQVLGFPDPGIPAQPEDGKSSGRRRVLADWIAGRQNPLTARVMVNRIWQHHFGRGIVRSSNNFGKLGDRPTHPELLDWLAVEFMRTGWDIKALHKQIMLSKTYQMSSQANEAGLQKDPNNDLFWRFDMRRLRAEEIRDSVLFLTGNLNGKMGGPSIFTDVPKEVLQTASQPDRAWGESAPEERNRRSVYVYVKRSLIEPVLGTFDLADADSPCAVRFSTTVPTQALTMLNSRFFNQQASALAVRLQREAGASPEEQALRAFSLALSREPTRAEVATAMEMIDRLQSEAGISAEKALERFCLLVINLNEFVYLD
jgi:hypothetical protein